MSLLVPIPKIDDWPSVIRSIRGLSNKLGYTASPTFVGMKFTGLTANRLMVTDGSKVVTSLTDLTSYISGTANRVAVTSDGDGTITLSGPQDIHTGASPTFANVYVADDGKIGNADNYFQFHDDVNFITMPSGTRLGFGTTPGSILHIKASGAPRLTIESSSSNTVGIKFITAGAAFINSYSGQKMRFISPQGTKMTILDGGNVGINDDAPAEKLTVNGNILVDGDLVFGTTGKGLSYGTISVVSNANETTITTQNVYVQVLDFDTNGVSNNVTPDHTNDHITITKAGDYKIECCITANSVSGAGSTFEFEVKKNNGASRVGSAHGDRTLSGGGSEAGSITICTIATLAVDDTIELWTKNETNTQNIIIEDASLSVLMIGG